MLMNFRTGSRTASGPRCCPPGCSRSPPAPTTPSLPRMMLMVRSSSFPLSPSTSRKARAPGVQYCCFRLLLVAASSTVGLLSGEPEAVALERRALHGARGHWEATPCKQRQRQLGRRQAELPTGLPHPPHHVLLEGPAGGADLRAVHQVEAPLALCAMPRH